MYVVPARALARGRDGPCWPRSRTRRAPWATSACGSTRGPSSAAAACSSRDAGYVEIERYNANHIADYFAEKRL